MLRISYILTITLSFLLSCFTIGQTVTYQIGTGISDSGKVVNTGTFRNAPIDNDIFIERGIMNTEYPSEPLYIDPNGAPVYESIYFEDTYNNESNNAVGDNALLLLKYNISLPNNEAPPDPTIAVGPNHVMVLTNNSTGIFIYDKQGNLLKSLNSTQWWSAVWPSQNGDPQIIFDHFSNRWVMVFMQIDDAAQTAGNLIAYSENENPIGTWYMYRLDTRTHGTTPSNTWGDYPQIGFDDKAIYVMTRCFGFAGGLFYNKIRIIPKAAFYSSNAGPFSYTDIWDITVPGSATRPDVIHPSFHYSVSNDHYFLFANRGGGNFYSFYKLSDPVGTPVLTGTNIFVPFYYLTPTAVQPGTTTRIESNGSHIKTAPVYRDGHLYATHSIRNSTNAAFGSVKYVKIDVNTNTPVEQFELGRDDSYYIFPAIAVDKDRNVLITASRSGPNEFASSVYLGRRENDLPGLSQPYMLQDGLATYVCTFCGERNRWGDYLGAYIDPSGEYDFWIVSQYASATNTYAVSIGNIRLKPYEGAYVHTSTPVLDFGRIEVGFDSDTITAYISNYGDTDLIISNIPDSSGAFHLVTDLTFPITIPFYDSLQIKFQFKPRQLGQLDQEYPFVNNSSNFTGFNLKGYGFIVFPAESNKFFAISGPGNDGKLLSIDPSSGTGVNLGPSFFNDLNSLSINPKTKFIFGMRTTGVNSEIIRINSQAGDGYKLFEINLPSLFSMAFDSSGQMYVVSTSGHIYSIDTLDGSYTSVSQLPVTRVSIAFNHLNNELWGTVKNLAGAVRDRLIKINLLTGDTTIVGQTGFGVNTVDLAFNSTGALYGIKGNNISPNDFFIIDQATGTGTLIGSVGVPDLKGLAFSTDISTSTNGENLNVPKAFTLEQNYPNPFNPLTNIKFTIPNSANVKLTVYNLLGESINVLLDKELQTGSYNIIWNADDKYGRKVSSGVYFYELKATSEKGSDFNQIRKMILLK